MLSKLIFRICIILPQKHRLQLNQVVHSNYISFNVQLYFFLEFIINLFLIIFAPLLFCFIINNSFPFNQRLFFQSLQQLLSVSFSRREPTDLCASSYYPLAHLQDWELTNYIFLTPLPAEFQRSPPTGAIHRNQNVRKARSHYVYGRPSLSNSVRDSSSVTAEGDCWLLQYCQQFNTTTTSSYR